jgi:hypothetical protein
MSARGYEKCVTCQKTWLRYGTRVERMNFAEYHRRTKPNPGDWDEVWFSDEVHFGLGPRRKLRIIRKARERYRQDYIQENPAMTKVEKRDKNVRIYAWGCVGIDWKSPLILYKSTNENDKMTKEVYLTQILSMVAEWVRNGKKFILEEDNDSGHGTSQD